VDGGPAERLGPVMGVGTPRAELADNGSAVIAYPTIDGVLTVDRAAGGSWLSHRIWRTKPITDAEGSDIPSLKVALASDGRAAVAWQGVLAAAGGAGGGLGAAVPPSAGARQGGQPPPAPAPPRAPPA